MENELTTGTANDGEAGVADVRFTEDCLVVGLSDGRTISAPLAAYPRLLGATFEQRAAWQVSGAGKAVHWPLLDEDLSVEGLLRGAASPEAGTLRFLALYVNKHGQPATAMLSTRETARLPFGVDEFELKLPDYDGEPVTLIEMPAGDFRPTVVDVETDAELPISFIDLP